MAAADVDRKLFFCHECSEEMYPTMPDYKCSQCDSSFVEEMEDTQRSLEGQEDRSAEFLD